MPCRLQAGLYGILGYKFRNHYPAPISLTSARGFVITSVAKAGSSSYPSSCSLPYRLAPIATPKTFHLSDSE